MSATEEQQNLEEQLPLEESTTVEYSEEDLKLGHELIEAVKVNDLVRRVPFLHTSFFSFLI